MEIGYSLSSEERTPAELVAHARLAEEAGFRFALVSDHFHPWIDEQGQSPFVWSVLGALSQATERMTFGTGVTCPTMRVHPAIVAQAAATCACLLPGRFFLGVGTGENLNEHVLGARWPSAEERLEMLEEAVGVIRELWGGGFVNHHGAHYTVDRARLYTVPGRQPPLLVAAAATGAAQLAGRIGDGLITTSPDEEIVEAFRDAGGVGKPCYGQLTVCVAESEEEAVETAYRHWPNIGLGGDLGQELPLPRHYRQAAETLTPEQIAAQVVCGPDPERHREGLERYREAGYDRVYVHQVGPEQERFLRLYERELLPHAVAHS
jgi:G6PDH family F420-dependent oxidoreductase